MEWIDTHVHISGVSPDGSVRESLAQDVAVVLDQAGADLRFVVDGCEAANAAEFRRMMEQPEGCWRRAGMCATWQSSCWAGCMVNAW